MSVNFLSLGIRPEACQYLQTMGLTTPTPIQRQAIGPLMSGRDIVAQAQTGTGKTLAFLLPILEKLTANKPYTQALIMTPTRELALQIGREAEKLAPVYHVQSLSLCGGHSVDTQIHRLKAAPPHIVIGTPGRLLDHIRRKTLNLSGLSKLVLDEADQMLHLGFLDDVETILRLTAGNRQTMLFSATIPSKIRNLADRYLKKPTDVRVQANNVTLDEIHQMVIETTEEAKPAKLCQLIEEYRPYLAMVFCHTRQRVTTLSTLLIQRGYLAEEFHGELSQNKREQIMKRFRTAKLQLLVTTDIAARGLDIEGVTHVFNYDIPHDAESYIHRIGRTGRAGQAGMALTFLVSGQQRYLRIIEQGIQASIQTQTAVTTANKTGRQLDKPQKTTPAIPKKRTPKHISHSGINRRSRDKTKANAASRPQAGKGKTQRRQKS